MILSRTDNDWDKLTPREFNSLMRVHKEVNDPKSKKNEKLTPIDKIPGL